MGRRFRRHRQTASSRRRYGRRPRRRFRCRSRTDSSALYPARATFDASADLEVITMIRRAIGPAVVLSALSMFGVSARANAPADRYVVAAGTVYDTKTKLTWQQTVTSTTFHASDAPNYCTNLGTTLSGGGWRLPTIRELATLIDHSQTSAPFIDRSAFPATPLHMFWSSTPLSGTANGPWVVDFSGGGISLPGMSDSNYVRCVR